MSPAKKKIFVFEDLNESFSILNNMLKSTYECRQLTVADPYLEELMSSRPVSLFLNIDIPEIDYQIFLKELKVHGILSVTSVILITDNPISEVPPELSSFGISDLIIRRSFTEKELYKTVSNSIEKLKLQNQILNLNIQLEHLTEKDRLTGLLSRDCLKNRLSDEINKVSRNIQTVCGAIINIDFFSTYNDTYGYHVGDQILIKIADVLRTFVRKTDLVFRYSGDEFLILFINEAKESNAPEKLSKNIADVCKKIQAKILEYTFEIDEKKQLKIYTSFGIAAFKSGSNVDDFLNNVDEALYHAKSHGKGKIAIYVEEDNIELSK